MVALWDTAVWDVDRWATLSTQDLLSQVPTSGGLKTGQGDWKLLVQILLPDAGSGLWGLGEWDEATWALLQWTDITDRVRGLEWTRGSDEVFGRPRVGRIALTLDNNDGTMDPWTAVSAQFLAPGTILRCGLLSPTGILDADYGHVYWLPQWTAIVESWDPIIVESNAADRFVQVTLNETVRDVAQVDDPELSSAVGANEGSWSRIERLLDAASWRYGTLLEAQNLTPAPTTAYGLQSTTMAQNRLGECYLVADSSDTQFRSIRDGRAALTASEYIGNVGDADATVWPLVLFSYYDTGAGRTPALYLDRDDDEIAAGGVFPAGAPIVGYRPSTFRSKTQDVEISNAVTLQRVGGVEQTFRQEASINRYGQRSFVRRDLLNKSGDDATVALLAQYISIRRALATLRIEAVTIDTWARPLAQFLATISTEPTDRALIYEPLGSGSRAYINGYVASITHRVSPRVSTHSVLWETDIRIDTRIVEGVPGAQLPATPA